MKLSFPDVGLSISFEENVVEVVNAESKAVLLDIVWGLNNLFSGKDSSIFLYEGDKELEITKRGEFIYNPFAISFNDKKFISRLYQELGMMVEEEMVSELTQINSVLVGFIDSLIDKQHYNLIARDEISAQDIFKLCELRFNCDEDGLLNRLVEYVKLAHSVLKKDLFIFIGLKKFFDGEELEGFYEACLYEKVNLLMIEDRFVSKLKHERNCIIDRDLCIIEVD